MSGENPAAADAAGINVTRTKYVNILLGGGICGIGGAYCSMIINGGVWISDNVGGLGWISVALVIFAAIYTTACPLLWTASSRFTAEGSPSFKIFTAALAAVGCVVALTIPFNILLNYIYVINGYGGFLLLILMFIKDMRLRFAAK